MAKPSNASVRHLLLENAYTGAVLNFLAAARVGMVRRETVIGVEAQSPGVTADRRCLGC